LKIEKWKMKIEKCLRLKTLKPHKIKAETRRQKIRYQLASASDI